MPNSPKRRLLRSEAIGEPADLGNRLREMYEAGPVGAGVPEAFVDLLVKLEAEQAELEKKQDG